MSGLFIAVVGPSGAGKDSLIRELARRVAGDSNFAVVRRYITRAADIHEDHETLDFHTFEAWRRADRFALWWEAHGLSYGVPAKVDAALSEGQTLLCNLSRGAVAIARARWPRVRVALVTASPATLAARIAARGREAPADLRARLERAPPYFAAPDATIRNDGELSHAADQLQGAVFGWRRET